MKARDSCYGRLETSTGMVERDLDRYLQAAICQLGKLSVKVPPSLSGASNLANVDEVRAFLSRTIADVQQDIDGFSRTASGRERRTDQAVVVQIAELSQELISLKDERRKLEERRQALEDKVRDATRQNPVNHREVRVKSQVLASHTSGMVTFCASGQSRNVSGETHEPVAQPLPTDVSVSPDDFTGDFGAFSSASASNDKFATSSWGEPAAFSGSFAGTSASQEASGSEFPVVTVSEDKSSPDHVAAGFEEPAVSTLPADSVLTSSTAMWAGASAHHEIADQLVQAAAREDIRSSSIMADGFVSERSADRPEAAFAPPSMQGGTAVTTTSILSLFPVKPVAPVFDVFALASQSSFSALDAGNGVDINIKEQVPASFSSETGDAPVQEPAVTKSAFPDPDKAKDLEVPSTTSSGQRSLTTPSLKAQGASTAPVEKQQPAQGAGFGFKFEDSASETGQTASRASFGDFAAFGSDATPVATSDFSSSEFAFAAFDGASSPEAGASEATTNSGFAAFESTEQLESSRDAVATAAFGSFDSFEPSFSGFDGSNSVDTFASFDNSTFEAFGIAKFRSFESAEMTNVTAAESFGSFEVTAAAAAATDEAVTDAGAFETYGSFKLSQPVIDREPSAVNDVASGDTFDYKSCADDERLNRAAAQKLLDADMLPSVGESPSTPAVEIELSEGPASTDAATPMVASGPGSHVSTEGDASVMLMDDGEFDKMLESTSGTVGTGEACSDDVDDIFGVEASDPATAHGSASDIAKEVDDLLGDVGLRREEEAPRVLTFEEVDRELDEALGATSDDVLGS